MRLIFERKKKNNNDVPVSPLKAFLTSAPHENAPALIFRSIPLRMHHLRVHWESTHRWSCPAELRGGEGGEHTYLKGDTHSPIKSNQNKGILLIFQEPGVFYYRWRTDEQKGLIHLANYFFSSSNFKTSAGNAFAISGTHLLNWLKH